MNEAVEPEEILLCSNEAEAIVVPEQWLDDDVNLEISQYSKWRQEYKTIKVFNNQFLHYFKLTPSVKQKYWINLAHVNPQGINSLVIKWKLALYAIMLNAFSGAIAYQEYTQLLDIQIPYAISIAVILFTCSLLLIVLMVHRSRSITTFYTQHGNIPVLEIFNNKPDKHTFQKFLFELHNNIKGAHRTNAPDPRQQLAAELAEHRRLKDEKIISEQTYVQAKKTIFSQHT